MKNINRGLLCLVAISLLCCAVSAQKTKEEPKPVEEKIPAGSKVFISPIPEFDTFLKDAFKAKKVPMVLVDDKSQADYEITGASNSQKASTAKKLIMGSWHSSEEASINLVNLKSGATVFAYSVHKSDSAHGKKSTAEACAKHLKERIDEK